MKKNLMFSGLIAAAAILLAQAQAQPLYNPYERPKNGPPLSKAFHKLQAPWLLRKLQEPNHQAAARMPDFGFSRQEALDIMAYLKSIAGAPPAVGFSWPEYASKTFDDMADEEIEAVFELSDQGKAVFGDARCTICHSINGPSAEPIGGFVDLRVGGIDLRLAALRLKRDWLYAWLEDPKNYFPDTLMPRYRLSQAQRQALVEYILRDDAFQTLTEEEDEEAPDWGMLDDPQRASRGKRLIEISRCTLCHDIQGVQDFLEMPRLARPASQGTFESLVYDLRCLSCHSVQGRGGSYAPDLTGEGSRLQGAWIAQFIASPDMVRPLSQQMPKFNLSDREAGIIAEGLRSRMLDSRIPSGLPGGPITPAEVQRGREAFQSRGCFSCHTSGEGSGGVVGPDLAAVGDRLTVGYLWLHLMNPKIVNPYSAEPVYGLSEEEARDLAAYLSTRKQ